MKLRLLAILVFFSFPTLAQQGSPPGAYGPNAAGGAVFVIANPATCTTGQSFFNTLTNQTLYCTATNTLVVAPAVPSGTISVLDPRYGAKGNARAITFSVASGSGTLTAISPATMTSADVQSLIYGGNNGISCLNKATVATIISGSSVTVTGATGGGNFSGCIGFVGTDDRAALRAACAASAAATPLSIRIPTAFYMVSDGNFCPLTTAASGATTLYGDGMDQTQIVYPPNDITVPVLDIEDTIAYVHDFSVDPGYRQDRAVNQSPVLMNTKYSARLRSNNFNGTSGGACLVFTVDGSQIDHPESSNCNSGIHIASQPMTIIDPQISSFTTGIDGFDSGDVIQGGHIVATNGVGILASSQGAAGQMWLHGVIASGTTGALNTVSPSTTNIFGGAMGFGPQGNAYGINVVSGATVNLSGVQIGSAGTGFGIVNNAGGIVKDLCGNFFTATGAGNYTGAGTIYNCPSAPINPKCLVASGVSPAACASASQGKIAVPATTTTYTVNTTAITANSTLLMFPTQDNSGITGAPTCAVVATPFAQATARVAGTSFSFSLPSNAGISCFEWTLQN
jgi:hypothetical protein